jgi:hypothetical protein
MDSFYSLQRNAAAGVDGVTWREYENILPQRVTELHRLIHAGAYRATPSRRVYIPKADGRQRPLGIASIEDKIVQQAVVTVLSAIYEVDFLGELHYLDLQGEPRVDVIERDKPYVLQSNSIKFVFLETKFRLPDYIALRFNLRITHVHRGLLLGTGPLIDPGFVGRLLIPLHNLTSEDYTLIGGKGFIWVEFTKLSPHSDWNSETLDSPVEYTRFPIEKKDLSAQSYFNKASNGKPSISSIPGEVKTAKESAESAKSQLKRLTWGAIIGAAVAFAGLFLPTAALVWEFIKVTQEYRKTVDALEKRVEAVEEAPKLVQDRNIVPAESTVSQPAKKSGSPVSGQN